jgi:aspartyl-tRNA synthetase
MLKSHNCGELRAAHIGQTVTLAGWVDRRRDQGGLIFLDLRDRWGITQIVFNATLNAAAHAAANESVRSEYVIQVTGVVRARPSGMENTKIATGQIDLEATAVKILNTAKTTPFSINTDDKVDEGLRLKYRYLDLRRARMQRNILLRGRVTHFIRDFLYQRGFVEIETPILFKTTPEGARDYLVPSRVHPGKFYALPQSPQQLKQLLMVGGYERYFQIARCFRDEDQRGDRQPEFTQLDLEMSFIEREDIMQLMESLMIGLVEQVSDRELVQKPFPRMSYKEAMEKYGCDKPDLRYGLEIVDVTDIVAKADFKVFAENVKAGNPVRALRIPGCGNYSLAQLSELEDIAKLAGARGLATFAVENKGGDGQAPTIKSRITKFFTPEQLTALVERTQAETGDLILFASDKNAVVCATLDAMRREFGNRLNLADPKKVAFGWVIDFPLFEWNADDKRWDPSHHLFTSPMAEDIPLLDTDPGKARGQQYDLACNGFEVGGGSIRIHDRALQEKIFGLIGLDVEDAKQRFGHMLEAFEYGTPPHGGMAPGIDRLVMVLAGENNIREVMAFPKNQQAMDVMAGAPSPADAHQLADLSIAVTAVEEDA